MAKKIMAQPRALGCTSNQTRDISEHRAVSCRAAHHPKIRNQGCERVIGNFGAGGRQNADQGALPCIREPNNPNFSEKLELQLQRPFFAVATLRTFFRSTVSIAEVVGIAQSSTPTKRHGEAFFMGGEIPEHDARTQMSDLSATRHLDH